MNTTHLCRQQLAKRLNIPGADEQLLAAPTTSTLGVSWCRRTLTHVGPASINAEKLELCVAVVGIPTSVWLNGGVIEATGRAKSTGGILHTNQHGGVRSFYLP
jgi:hypothetical protein